jgi:hypothetical protein
MQNQQTLEQLKCQLEDFFMGVLQGKFDYLPDYAKKLQELSDKAWEKVEEMTPPSIRIDP